ncbi:MAG: hypothetical protein Q7R80_00265 [bacterium]|nr:hypothetical protein [bacterium]
MAAVGALAKFAKMAGEELEDLDLDNPEFQAALSNPDMLRELVRDPKSKLVGVASRLLTGQALKASWRYLLPTYGLTLIYLNFHFCARHFAHRKGFTPFGSEWKIWRTVLGWPGFALKYVEVIVLIFLDVLVALIILIALALLAIIGWAATHPLEAIAVIGKDLVDLIK